MSGGDNIVVNFGTLAQAVQDINNGINSMRSTLDDCEQAANVLLPTWEGAAQEAYAIRQARWRSASNDLTQMLTDIKAAVEDSASNFQQAEDRNKALFE
jgi:6 kDa early secretory antigenic target